MKKLMFSVICLAAALSLTGSVLHAFPAPKVLTAAAYEAEITDPETIIRMLSAYIEENNFSARCFIAGQYEQYPEYEGKIVIEYERDKNPDNFEAMIKEYVISQKMDTYLIHPARLENGSRPEPADPSDPFKKIPDEIYAAFDAGAEAIKVFMMIVNPSPDAAERSAMPGKIMQAVGIEPEAAVVADEAYIFCMINSEQLAGAAQNDSINRIRRCDTWTYSGEIPADTSDPEAVRAMFTQLFTENNLDAKCAESVAYPDYSEPVILEYNLIEGGPNIGMILREFAAKYQIGREMFTTVVFQNGVPVTTVIPAEMNNTPGDADCRDGVDVSDAVLTARFAAEDSTAQMSAQGKRNADLNADGKITAEDVISILKIIAKVT